eukprot:TRINITY_DN73869_c0_g1_i1.p1 TRINITY_DN73869_c0_g1~~TRINITY_DN73869_c0_g1_i1.p1  ORF type:complete len:1614 (+),score=250.98 TRINITY_DN73869_c0_g1_i1:97-4938(+)
MEASSVFLKQVFDHQKEEVCQILGISHGLAGDLLKKYLTIEAVVAAYFDGSRDWQSSRCGDFEDGTIVLDDDEIGNVLQSNSSGSSSSSFPTLLEQSAIVASSYSRNSATVAQSGSFARSSSSSPSTLGQSGSFARTFGSSTSGKRNPDDFEDDGLDSKKRAKVNSDSIGGYDVDAQAMTQADMSDQSKAKNCMNDQLETRNDMNAESSAFDDDGARNRITRGGSELLEFSGEDNDGAFRIKSSFPTIFLSGWVDDACVNYLYTKTNSFIAKPAESFFNSEGIITVGKRFFLHGTPVQIHSCEVSRCSNTSTSAWKSLRLDLSAQARYRNIPISQTSFLGGPANLRKRGYTFDDRRRFSKGKYFLLEPRVLQLCANPHQTMELQREDPVRNYDEQYLSDELVCWHVSRPRQPALAKMPTNWFLIPNEKVKLEECAESLLVVSPDCILEHLRFSPDDLEQSIRILYERPNYYYGKSHFLGEELRIPNNDADETAACPAGWNVSYPLRPEQLRSLRWMLDREMSSEVFEAEYRCFELATHYGTSDPTQRHTILDLDGSNGVCPCEHLKDGKTKLPKETKERITAAIATAARDATNTVGARNPVWLERRSVAKYHFRGGVLCDQVGYGKTATTIALIQSIKKMPEKPGTLILAPGHLLRQWEGEIKKFIEIGKHRPTVLVCDNVTPLKSETKTSLLSYDIVLVTYRLFYSQIYQTRVKLDSVSGGEWPVFEDIFWKRVVYDEFHEVESFSRDPEQMRMLLKLRGEAIWGLTGTPNAESVRGIVAMASLFRIDILGTISAEHLHFFDRVQHSAATMDDEQFMEYAKVTNDDADRPIDFCWNCGAPWSEMKNRFGAVGSQKILCAYCNVDVALGKNTSCVDGDDGSISGPRVSHVDRDIAKARLVQLQTHALDRSRIFVANAQLFVQMYMRQNSAESLVSDIRLQEMVVAVNFQHGERALYMNEMHKLKYSNNLQPSAAIATSFDAGPSLGGGKSSSDNFSKGCAVASFIENDEDDPNFHQTMQCDVLRRARLLMLCSHFSTESLSAMNTNCVRDSNDQCKRVSLQRKKELTVARNRVRLALKKLECIRRCDPNDTHSSFSASYPQVLKEIESFFALNNQQNKDTDWKVFGETEILNFILSSTPAQDRNDDPLMLLNAGTLLTQAFGQQKKIGDGQWVLCDPIAYAIFEPLMYGLHSLTPKGLHMFEKAGARSIDIADVKHRTLEELTAALAPVQSAFDACNFFQKTLALFRSSASAEIRCCSICMVDDLKLSELSITPCAHVFCTDCAKESAEVHQKCAMCTRPLKVQDLQNLALEIRDHEEDEKKQENEMKEHEKAAKKLMSSSSLEQSLEQSSSSSTSDGANIFTAGDVRVDGALSAERAKSTFLSCSVKDGGSNDIGDVNCQVLRRRVKITNQNDSMRCVCGVTSANSLLDAEEPLHGHFQKYGAKIQRVIQVLQYIQKRNPTDKAIVFVQWDVLKKKVAAALDTYNLKHDILHGSSQRKKIVLADFKHRSSCRILIMSLETSASGTNLTEASHVLLVHPMNAETLDKRVAYELQAIGRVRRYGQQKKEVHVWKFLAINTVETEMFRETRQALEDREWHKEKLRIVLENKKSEK